MTYIYKIIYKNSFCYSINFKLKNNKFNSVSKPFKIFFKKKKNSDFEAEDYF